MGGKGSGRKPTPAHLKKLRGNPGKRKIAPSISVSPLGQPPSWLDGDALVEWHRIAPGLIEANVAAAIDGIALAMLCETHSHYRSLVVQSRKQPTPEIRKAIAKTFTTLRIMLREFGMTPASRIATAAPQEQDPLGQFIDDTKRE